MEDNLKILNVKYLSNRLLDLTQILNFDFGDQRKAQILQMKTTSHKRRPQKIKSGISHQQLIGS